MKVAARIPRSKIHGRIFFQSIFLCVGNSELRITGGSEHVFGKNHYMLAPSTQYWLLPEIG